MLKKYKNRFVAFANSLDFGTNNYEIIYSDDPHLFNVGSPARSEIIIKIQDDFFYSIRCSMDNWHDFEIIYSLFQPNYPLKSWPLRSSAPFEFCLEQIHSWKDTELTEFLLEKNQPDLLTPFLEGGNKRIPKINFSDNSAFELEEKQLLKQGLGEIRGLLQQEFSFTQEQLVLINHRIDYLEDGIERLGKTDWKGILISTILSIITSLALDPEKAEKLLRLFANIIDNIPQLEF